MIYFFPIKGRIKSFLISSPLRGEDKGGGEIIPLTLTLSSEGRGSGFRKITTVYYLAS